MADQGKSIMEIGSSSHSAPTYDLDKWIESIEESTKTLPETKSKIQLVPHSLRSIEGNVDCFEPIMVAIGPIHRSKAHLQPMEQLKPHFIRLFKTEYKVSYQELFNSVASVLDEAKDAYEASVIPKDLTDMEFIQMMCMDGCFILQYIVLAIHNRRGYPLSNVLLKANDVMLVRRDLYLLENQVPLVVLLALSRSTMKPEGLFRNLIKYFDYVPNTYKMTYNVMYERSDFEKLVFSSEEEFASQLSIRFGITYQTPHLLACGHSLMINIKVPVDKEELPFSMVVASIKSAAKLRSSGISFRPTRTQEVNLISFESYLFSGKLRVPCLMVDGHTKSKLLNMAAYEACSGGPHQYHVSSYICFLNELIVHEEDVEVLKHARVLYNSLGSTQEVAELFNGISKGLMSYSAVYQRTRSDIESHYSTKFYIWVADLVQHHIVAPWKMIGLAAAILLICLAAIQTWFTVHPSK